MHVVKISYGKKYTCKFYLQINKEIKVPVCLNQKGGKKKATYVFTFSFITLFRTKLWLGKCVY